MNEQNENGFILVTLLTLMIPLLIVVGAVSSAMTGKSNELVIELDQEVALLAAESGVDDAIYQGRIGALVDGMSYQLDIGSGQSFEVTATYLRTDGTDNDSDGLTDESDEDVFQIIVTGSYRSSTRRLAAYLGPAPLLPAMTSAFATQDPNLGILLQGTPQISGWNTNIDGSAAGAGDVPALTVAPPGTVASLSAELTGSEPSKVVGPGGPPSLGNSPVIDVATLVGQIQNTADIVLTSDSYSSFDFGDGSAGTAHVSYRDGDVSFQGNTRGAGILVVTGDLSIKGTFRFDGVVIVLGAITNSAGTAQIFGSVLQGPAGGQLTLKGTADIRYSAEAVNLANSIGGRYVSFNGWQELSN